jgi:hypothetical protein
MLSPYDGSHLCEANLAVSIPKNRDAESFIIARLVVSIDPRSDFQLRRQSGQEANIGLGPSDPPLLMVCSSLVA